MKIRLWRGDVVSAYPDMTLLAKRARDVRNAAALVNEVHKRGGITHEEYAILVSVIGHEIDVLTRIMRNHDGGNDEK